MKQVSRYLTAGIFMIALYVGSVWVSTEILEFPARAANFIIYVACTLISFTLAYKWVFAATVNPRRALVLFSLLQVGGIILNALWLEAGLRFTPLYPWIIAASFFIFWPFLSYRIQQGYIFKR